MTLWTVIAGLVAGVLVGILFRVFGVGGRILSILHETGWVWGRG